MDVNHVNPFIQSFASVMPSMGFATVTKGKLSIKEQELVKTGVIIIVGIVGSIKGNVVYTIDFEDAKKIASTMMMGMPVEELDEMSKSALSEMANMLTANAATVFYSQGILIDISTPTLLYGTDVDVKMSSHQVIGIQMIADDIPVEINVAFNN